MQEKSPGFSIHYSRKIHETGIFIYVIHDTDTRKNQACM